MFRIAICDDEKLYLDRIEETMKENLYLQAVSRYEITTYSSAVEFFSLGEKLLQFDAIFLDINMPEISGLEIAKWIRERSTNILLVFISSFANYSFEGYKFEITRFVLKDMLDEMLPECIEAVVRKLKVQAKKIEYVFLEGRRSIFVDQIHYVESKKHRLTFHVEERKMATYLLYEKLDIVEEDLAAYGFFRIHKSYLVNIKYTKEIANYKVKLKNGTLLPVPREKFQETKETYYEMVGELL